MECSKQNQAQIVSMVSGDLSSLQAWLLRGHLRRCPACRAQWEQTQRLWTGMQALASAPASERLSGKRQLKLGEKTVKRRTLAMTCAVTILLVTGALAARLIHFQASGDFSDKTGRMWSFTTDFKGEMMVFDAEGHLVGTSSDGSGDSENGKVEVQVSGEKYLIHGIGRHDFRDSKGILVGYAILSPLSNATIARMNKEAQDRMPQDFKAAAKWQEQHMGGGASGITAGPTIVAGFDQSLKVFWMMRGIGKVVVKQSPSGTMVGQGESENITPEMMQQLPEEIKQNLPTPLTEDEIKTPQFAIKVAGKTTYETGYGRHFVQDDTGKTLFILEATPPRGK